MVKALKLRSIYLLNAVDNLNLSPIFLYTILKINNLNKQILLFAYKILPFQCFCNYLMDYRTIQDTVLYSTRVFKTYVLCITFATFYKTHVYGHPIGMAATLSGRHAVHRQGHNQKRLS